MKRLRIILMGLDFNSTKLGCSALGYSFLSVLDKVSSSLDVKLNLVSVNYADASMSGKNYALRNLSTHPQKYLFEDNYQKRLGYRFNV